MRKFFKIYNEIIYIDSLLKELTIEQQNEVLSKISIEEQQFLINSLQKMREVLNEVNLK